MKLGEFKQKLHKDTEESNAEIEYFHKYHFSCHANV